MGIAKEVLFVPYPVPRCLLAERVRKTDIGYMSPPAAQEKMQNLGRGTLIPREATMLSGHLVPN